MITILLEVVSSILTLAPGCAVKNVLPVVIKEVIPVEGVNSLEGNRVRFSELAKQHGLDYLVVVVASSTEQEYPVTLFLGWTTHSQPGYRRDNWSLLEFVLLDVKRGCRVEITENFILSPLAAERSPRLPASIQTRRMLMSAGLTPLMRLACPRVIGLI